MRHPVTHTQKKRSQTHTHTHTHTHTCVCVYRHLGDIETETETETDTLTHTHTWEIIGVGVIKLLTITHYITSIRTSHERGQPACAYTSVTASCFGGTKILALLVQKYKY